VQLDLAQVCADPKEAEAEEKRLLGTVRTWFYPSSLIGNAEYMHTVAAHAAARYSKSKTKPSPNILGPDEGYYQAVVDFMA
jgi:hypothetical protein